MACGATLKRHHEFDPHFGLPDGCSPKRIKLSYEDMMATDSYEPHHNFVEATKRLGSDQLPMRISSPPSNSFQRVITSPYTWRNIASSLTSPKSPPTQTKICQPKNELMITTSVASYVCNQLVEEHERNLREHYDKILTNKLAEKYESYIKFNHDILKSRFCSSSASYVS